MEQVVDHYTYIHFAARDGDADALRRELKRGVSPNMVSPERISPLHLAASARGASDARCEDGNSPLDNCISQREAYLQRGLDAESEGQRRLYPLLLRAGAALPAQSYDPYIQKVIAAGSFRTYERNHLNAIAATFLPKLPSLPPEMVRRVVEYAFHVGDY